MNKIIKRLYNELFIAKQLVLSYMLTCTCTITCTYRRLFFAIADMLMMHNLIVDMTCITNLYLKGNLQLITSTTRHQKTLCSSCSLKVYFRHKPIRFSNFLSFWLSLKSLISYQVSCWHRLSIISYCLP